MTLTFTAHTHDRQATKADLVDIARALGCSVTEHQELAFVREKLRTALRQRNPQATFGAYAMNGRQVTKVELLAYLRALSPTTCSDKTPVPRMREILRGLLTRLHERARRDSEFAAQPEAVLAAHGIATEAAVLTAEQIQVRAENGPLQRQDTAVNELALKALDLINETDALPQAFRADVRAHLRAIVDLLTDE